MAAHPVFVVHEHHASRRHFDFRLEINGVLKSWAVPKGPSLNPLEKRLAVMVDDHPLAYGTFEGMIPAGPYGAGPVVIWDRGALAMVEGHPATALTRGALKFTLTGRRLKGRFALVKLKGPHAAGKEWRLMKTADAFANPRFTLVSALTPTVRRRLIERRPPCHAA